jgi:hypothetical protein
MPPCPSTFRAAAAGDVLDHDLLAERLAHVLPENAREHVGRSARGERHDHGDRPDGVGLLRPCARTGGDQQSRGEYDGSKKPHHVLLDSASSAAVASCALSQPKSDLSDFGRLKMPNSAKPEIGAEKGTMVSPRIRMGEGVRAYQPLTQSRPTQPPSHPLPQDE